MRAAPPLLQVGLAATVLQTTTTVVSGNEEACIAAFSQAKDSCKGEEVSDLTLDQLLNDPCPEGCQSDLDAMMEKCSEGDKVSSWETYDNRTFFWHHLYWASCNDGYEPSLCTLATKFALDYLPCDGSATIEQLENDDCPTECQARYNFVMESCLPGDDIFFSLESSGNHYGPTYLYHMQGGYPRAKCDVGYNPSECSVAIYRVRNSTTTTSFHPGSSGIGCHLGENRDVCSPECRALLDSVVATCNIPNSTFSAYRDDFAILPFDGQKSLDMLGLKPPPPNPFDSHKLSEKCWNYLVDSNAKWDLKSSEGTLVPHEGDSADGTDSPTSIATITEWKFPPVVAEDLSDDTYILASVATGVLSIGIFVTCLVVLGSSFILNDCS